MGQCNNQMAFTTRFISSQMERSVPIVVSKSHTRWVAFWRETCSSAVRKLTASVRVENCLIIVRDKSEERSGTRGPFLNFSRDSLNRINLALTVLRKTEMLSNLLQFHIRMNGEDCIAGVIENTVTPLATIIQTNVKKDRRNTAKIRPANTYIAKFGQLL